MYPWLASNSQCRPGWPHAQTSACHGLPSASFKGVHHHFQPKTFLSELHLAFLLVHTTRDPLSYHGAVQCGASPQELYRALVPPNLWIHEPNKFLSVLYKSASLLLDSIPQGGLV